MAEAVVGYDYDVGLVAEPEFAQPVEQEADLAVIVADGGARLRRSGADCMLEVVGFGEPIDYDVGPKLSQHVLAQHPLRPRDFFVGRIEDAALWRSGRKPAQDCVVRRIRATRLPGSQKALTRIPIPFGARGLTRSALPVVPELTTASVLPRCASISARLGARTMPPPVTSSRRIKFLWSSLPKEWLGSTSRT
jgi:hypothetical protein